MKLGIDIDGVLYDWEGTAREILQYGHIYGMPQELDQEQYDALYPSIAHWDRMEEIVGKENWDWLWANQNKLKAYLSPNDHGQENWLALGQLGERHDTYLITSRPKDCWWQTYHWLTMYGEQMPANLAGVLHTSDKVALAQALGLDVVLDDRPSQLEKYRVLVARELGDSRPPVYVYGVRRAWNDKLHTDEAIRWVDGVADLLKEEWA